MRRALHRCPVAAIETSRSTCGYLSKTCSFDPDGHSGLTFAEMATPSEARRAKDGGRTWIRTFMVRFPGFHKSFEP